MLEIILPYTHNLKEKENHYNAEHFHNLCTVFRVDSGDWILEVQKKRKKSDIKDKPRDIVSIHFVQLFPRK